MQNFRRLDKKHRTSFPFRKKIISFKMHYSSCVYTQDQQLFQMIHIQQSVIWDRHELFLILISKSLITWLAFPPYWIKILTTSALPATVPWCKALIPNLFTSFTDAPNSEKINNFFAKASSRGLVVKAEDPWLRSRGFEPPLRRPFFRHHSFGSKAWSNNWVLINLALLDML